MIICLPDSEIPNTMSYVWNLNKKEWSILLSYLMSSPYFVYYLIILLLIIVILGVAYRPKTRHVININK